MTASADKCRVAIGTCRDARTFYLNASASRQISASLTDILEDCTVAANVCPPKSDEHAEAKGTLQGARMRLQQCDCTQHK